VRPHQPALKSVARHGFFTVLDIVADLEGGRPRDAGKFEDPGIIASDVSR
jgi:hypothetical protein